MSFVTGLWGLAGAVVLLTCCWSFGLCLLHAGGLVEGRPADGENQVFAAGVGMGVLSFLFLIVGLLNALSPWTVFSVLTLVTLISTSYLTGRHVVAIDWPRFRRRHLFLGGFILFAAALNLLSAMAPPTDADSLRHHLAAPEFYASQGGFEFKAILWWNLPSAQHVHHTVQLILFNDRSVQLLAWLLGLLVCLVLFFLSRRVLSSVWPAGLVVAIFYSIPLTTYLAGMAYVEFAVAFYALLSVLAIVRSGEASERLVVGWVLLSGLLAGFAGASKLWGLLVPVAGAVTLLVHGWFKNWRAPRLLANCGVYCAAVLLVLSPWLLRNFAASGDPLWPLMSSVLANDYWQPWQIEKFAAWERGAGVGLLAFLASPWTLTARVSDYSVGAGVLSPFLLPPILLAFAPAGWLLRRGINKEGRQILILTFLYGFVFYCCWWLLGYHHPRYIHALHPLIALWSGIGIVLLLKECRKPALRYLIGGLACCSLLAMLAVSIFYNARALPVVLGMVSERGYLERNVPFYRSLKWVSRNLPDDARILFLGLQGFYYLDRAYDPGMPAYQGLVRYSDFEQPGDLYRELISRGWTHIYFEGIHFENSRDLEDALAKMPADLDSIEREEWKPVILLAPLLNEGKLKEIYCMSESMIRSRTFRREESASVAIYEVAGEL